jgi:uncharacterized membrane protein
MNGITYPLALASISGAKNILTKSYFLDFIKETSPSNSSMFFMFYKHFIKSIVYTIIAIIAFVFFKDNYFKKSEKVLKSHSHLIKYLFLFSIIEIALGFMFYKSLEYNNLNKFIIYFVIFTILINSIIAHLIYKEQMNIQLILGYIICIIGVLVVKFS